MGKFNQPARRTATRSPVQTATAPSGRNHQGGAGYARDVRSELFLLAVTNMVSENTFYENGRVRDERFTGLVRKAAVDDAEWTRGFIGWLRADAGMRSASMVAGLEAVRGRLDAGLQGGNRKLVDAALQRADEPGEALAYWTSVHGRAIPKPVKRGIGDAVRRLYNERSLAKYDSGSGPFRFGDVLNLTHAKPDPGKRWQGDLFSYALDRRHGRGENVPASLTVLRARAQLLALPAGERRQVVTSPAGPERLRAAGMTWEAVAGWLQGPMDAAVWEALIPSMGFFALVRNLRNFDQAQVSDAVAQQVASRLADAVQVRSSRMFPFRFLAADKAVASRRWAWALEQALNHSLANVPALRGRTLVLVDRSGSMFGPVSEKSGLNRADSAALFGTALAVRAEHADLVEFGTGHQPVAFSQNESVLDIVEKFRNLGGTNTSEAVRANYRGHDRVVILTDEQANYSRSGGPTAHVPAHVPVYTWNLAGYQYGHGPSGTAHRHTFGGLSDAAWQMIPLLESGRDAGWPWETTAGS